MIAFPDINSFISTYWGMYIVQNIIHSMIAFLVVEIAIISWKIRTPNIQQWFRILVIFLPVAAFPFYQLLSPHRGDVYFRVNSLFDSNRLLFLEMWGGISVLTIFILILAFTTLIFIIQELMPVISDILKKKPIAEEEVSEDIDESMEIKIAAALNGLPVDRHAVEILNDSDLILFSTTGKEPKIYVSTGIIESFSEDHLNVAFAHEIAHIQRSRRPVLILAYLFRIIMFFNPVAMIEFRRLAQEEEKVCDDIAIQLTGKPDVLTEAVEILRASPEDLKAETDKGIEGIVSAVENYSHDILLQTRIQRIAHYSQDDIDWWGIPYCLTATIIICINYFVV